MNEMEPVECDVCFTVLCFASNGHNAGWIECVACRGTPAATMAYNELSVDAYDRRQKVLLAREVSSLSPTLAKPKVCWHCGGLSEKECDCY